MIAQVKTQARPLPSFRNCGLPVRAGLVVIENHSGAKAARDRV